MISLPRINKKERDAVASPSGGELHLSSLIGKLENGTCAPLQVAVLPLVDELIRVWTAAVASGAGLPSASKDKTAADAAEELIGQRNLVLEGVAGTGKTYLIEELAGHLRYLFLKAQIERANTTAAIKRIQTSADDVKIDPSKATAFASEVNTLLHNMQAIVDGGSQGSVTVVVLHPGASYEELIIGLRPTSTGSVQHFVWKAGQLLKAIREGTKAWQAGAGGPHLLVLDEINRCNLPAVLGELMLLVDPTRRVTKAALSDMDDFESSEGVQRCVERGLGVRMPHIQDVADKDFPKLAAPVNDLLWIPDNIYILGTMNSSDRSILGFDQALRRRFPPFRIEPLPHPRLEKALQLDASKPEDEVWITAIEGWAALNAFLRFAIGPDAMIGHSYWFAAREQARHGLLPEKAIKDAWRFGILPQAIHSAESARREQMLAELFADGNPSMDWFPDRNSLKNDDVRKRRWEESCGKCGPFSDNPETMRTHIKSHGFSILLLGDGHGEKLNIQEDGLPKKQPQSALDKRAPANAVQPPIRVTPKPAEDPQTVP